MWHRQLMTLRNKPEKREARLAAAVVLIDQASPHLPKCIRFQGVWRLSFLPAKKLAELPSGKCRDPLLGALSFLAGRPWGKSLALGTVD